MFEFTGLVVGKAALGYMVSYLMTKIRSGISKSDFAIRLKEGLKTNSEKTCADELKKWFSTVLIKSFKSLAMSKDQQKDIMSCREFKETVVDFMLHGSSNIAAEAERVDYSRWEFRLSGYNVRTLLITIAREIESSIATFLSPEHQIIINHITKKTQEIPDITVAKLRGDPEELVAIKDLIKVGKIKEALTRANMLNKIHFSNQKPDSFRLSVLEQILICQNRLPYFVSSRDCTRTIFEIIDHIVEPDRKEKCEAILSCFNNNFQEALIHSNKSVALNPQSPGNNALNCELTFRVEGTEAAKVKLYAISPEIIMQSPVQFAHCYLFVENYDKAEECALKYLESNSTDIESLVILADIEKERIEDMLSSTNSLASLNRSILAEFEQRLHNVKCHLNCIEDELYSFQYYIMEGALQFWKHNFQQGAFYYRKAYELNPSDEVVLQTLVRMLRRSTSNNNNAELIELANKLDSRNFTSFLGKNIVLLDYGEAESVLTNVRGYSYKNELDRNQLLQLCEIELIALKRLTRRIEAKAVEEKIQLEFSDLPYAYKIHADFLLEYGKYEEAKECLRTALLMNNEDSINLHLQEILFELLAQSTSENDIQEAIQLGKSLFRTSYIGRGMILYLQLLFNQKKLADCIELCREIEAECGADNTVKDIEANALYHLKEFARCVEICKMLYMKQPYNLKTIELLCWSLFGLNQYTELQELIGIAEPKLSGKSTFLVLCSKVFREIHLTRLDDVSSINTAFEYGRRAVEVSNESQSCVEYYIYMWLSFLNESTSHINDNYMLLGHNLLKTYKVKFPDSNSFQQIESNDTKELVDTIIDKFSRDESHDKNIIDTYNQLRAPISFLSKAYSKDIYTTWKYAIVMPNMKIWLCDSSINDFQAENEVINGKVDALISVHSFFLLHKLGLLDNNLTNSFNSLSITQTGWEELQALRKSMLKNATEGSKTLHVHNGHISITEIEAEVHQRELELIDHIINFIVTNCQKVGQHTIAFNPDDDLKFHEVFGVENAELMLSKNIQFVVFSDDWRVRDCAKAISGKDSTFILPYLRKLRASSLIDDKKYCSCIVELLRNNYYRIPIEKKVIQQVIYDSSYTISDDVRLCLTALYDNTLDAEALFILLLDLLSWIWLEPIMKESKDIFTTYVVDIIAQRTSRLKAIHFVEMNIPNMISPLNLIALDDLSNLMNHLKKVVIL